MVAGVCNTVALASPTMQLRCNTARDGHACDASAMPIQRAHACTTARLTVLRHVPSRWRSLRCCPSVPGRSPPRQGRPASTPSSSPPIRSAASSSTWCRRCRCSRASGCCAHSSPRSARSISTLPGINSSSYYGPNASRPVIRGLDGDRVRILQNGLGVFDASGTSVDHAVAHRHADGRGASRSCAVPATLLYGPTAIGGVVNVIDAAFPTSAPGASRPASTLRYASPGQRTRRRRDSSRSATTHGLQLHVDGFKRRTDDLRIAGYAYSPQLRDASGRTSRARAGGCPTARATPTADRSGCRGSSQGIRGRPTRSSTPTTARSPSPT